VVRAAEWYERLSGTRCQRKWSMASTLLQDITVVVVGDVDERLFVRGEQVSRGTILACAAAVPNTPLS
jgi:hypothetical protein